MFTVTGTQALYQQKYRQAASSKKTPNR